MIWSIAATILLLLLLLDIHLVTGLLVERGRLDISILKSDVSRFETVTGLKVIADKDPEPDPKLMQAGPNHVPIYYDEHGLLPVVWHSRGAWWGPFNAYLYRQVGWLHSNTLALIWLLSVGVLLLVFRTFCLKRVRSLCHRCAIDAVTATRRNLHRQVLRLGPEDLDGTAYETAIQLFTVEVETIRQGLYESLLRIVRFPLELFGLSVVLLSLDWRLTLQWIAPLALGLMLLNGVRKTAIKNQRLAEDQSYEEEQALLASLKNARLTRGLGVEQTEHEQFQKHLDRYHSQLMDFARATDVVIHPQSKVVASCAGLVAFLVFLVCDQVLGSRNGALGTGMTVSDAMTFFVGISLAIPGILALKTLSHFRRNLALAADKVLRYLDRIPSVSQAVGAKFLQPLSKTLHFENVKYQTSGGRKILNGVDFKLEVDKSLAIVSIEPLEARAIALMLPRFIEPREGRVMIDGEDISWVTLESLRAETVFVAADDPPLEGTVFENICAGRSDLTLQQVTEAAKMTHAHNFIVKLFNGYETILNGQRDALDVGQRFRLSLARAIVRDPALLIIEEPPEALDEDTKTMLVDAYDRICRERTVIFLPARMSTVRRTDQIIVLYEGKVAAMGPHSKLITQSPFYRHWEYLRFNEFRNES